MLGVDEGTQKREAQVLLQQMQVACEEVRQVADGAVRRARTAKAALDEVRVFLVVCLRLVAYCSALLTDWPVQSPRAYGRAYV